GAPSAIVPAGAPLLSDPGDLDPPALGDPAISIHFPEDTATTTVQSVAPRAPSISWPGDHPEAVHLAGVPATRSQCLLAALPVNSRNRTAIGALGDSITDGTGSTPDMNNRWPNQLAERLLREDGWPDTGMGVLDEGISGNRVLTDGSGVNALARFDRDVLTQP